MASINLDPLLGAVKTAISNSNIHNWLGVAVMVLTLLYTQQGDLHPTTVLPAPAPTVIVAPPGTPPETPPGLTPEERKLLDIFKLPAYEPLRKHLLTLP